MSIILAAEDALIACAKAALGNHVRAVESLPGDWDDDMLRRLLRAVPGVFVAFAGGQRGRSGRAEAAVEGSFVVYVVTGHASGETARRRGDALQLGAYDLVEMLLPRMHGLQVADVGSFSLQDVANLYTGTIDRTGVAVYAMTYSIPMIFEADAADLELANFATFEAMLDVPRFDTAAEHRKWLAGTPTDTAPNAVDRVSLPTP